MPVRRRKSRARPDEVAAWSGYMLCGADFFDDLAGVGLTEETAAALAEVTWHRIGLEVLAHLDRIHVGFRPYERPIWAEERFGAPVRRGGPKYGF
ncbi:hypothetical protein [Mesorhizobium sp. 8]|uniref:hypothetical protein n=1 Tax=Mesorhizobium sp. 8 TaxID=2584466 RepID=UPI00111DAAFF|nr:hypothetical protein [Mesorhizobium sp. 8]QDB99780.1 hypothetical protein FGU64_04795 [Mesorhizobium sp. 8]